MPRHEQWLYMAFMSSAERSEAAALAGLAYCNPFLPERIAHERAVLGDDFVATEEVWTMRAGREVQNVNIERTQRRAERLVARLGERLTVDARPGADDLRLFEEVVLYVLYNRYALALWEVIERDKGHERVAAWSAFRDDAERLLAIPGVAPRTRTDLAALFAAFFQLRLPVTALDVSTPLTALAADSLDLVELAIALEEDVGVPLGHEELEAVRTVGDLIEVIARAANAGGT